LDAMDERLRELTQKRSQVRVLFRPLLNPQLWGFYFYVRQYGGVLLVGGREDLLFFQATL
jgi:hypothetical protein